IWESPGSYTTDTYLWIESGITGTCVVLALVKDAYSSEPQAGSIATLFKYTGAYGRLEGNTTQFGHVPIERFFPKEE
ncbi:MAG: hypothetical protein PHS52_05585, partial [Desulfotomaculaceae bacterium]|nr:hypothetical protein [Desulfotomaculaceae bacterium]